jgi:hypothetical protein
LFDNKTHPALDIYDNAMFLTALDNLVELGTVLLRNQTELEYYINLRKTVARSVRNFLWDQKRQKFHPHVYLDKGTPFPPTFDEEGIWYHGGFGVASQVSGLLSRSEIKAGYEAMKRNAKAAGVSTISLAVFPPYPLGKKKKKHEEKFKLKTN